MRTTFTLDDELAERARRLGINISAAAREGVAAAVRAALAAADRAQTMLTGRVGAVGDATMHRVCSAVSYALGC